MWRCSQRFEWVGHQKRNVTRSWKRQDVESKHSYNGNEIPSRDLWIIPLLMVWSPVKHIGDTIGFGECYSHKNTTILDWKEQRQDERKKDDQTSKILQNDKITHLKTCTNPLGKKERYTENRDMIPNSRAVGPEADAESIGTNSRAMGPNGKI